MARSVLGGRPAPASRIVPPLPDRITIGELATRSGVATSTLRYYETKGLIRAEGSPGNQRRFARATLRRVAFVRAAQGIGLPLQEIRDALGKLLSDRTPTKADASPPARRGF